VYVAEPAIFARRNGCPAVDAFPRNENDNAVTFA
jgi:hypothetical protein